MPLDNVRKEFCNGMHLLATISKNTVKFNISNKLSSKKCYTLLMSKVH